MRQDQRHDEDMRVHDEPMPVNEADYRLPADETEDYPERSADRPDDPMMTGTDEHRATAAEWHDETMDREQADPADADRERMADGEWDEDRTREHATVDGMAAEPVPAEPVTTESMSGSMSGNGNGELARPVNGADDEMTELFQPDMVERFRTEWQDIQTRFVDDPRDAVQGADRLVNEVVEALTTTVNQHKHELEGKWQQGSDSQTEDLRLALRRYRSFLNQLLNV